MLITQHPSLHPTEQYTVHRNRRRMSAFVQEQTVRRGDDEIDTKPKSSTHSAAVLPQMLTAENLKGIASVEVLYGVVP